MTQLNLLQALLVVAKLKNKRVTEQAIRVVAEEAIRVVAEEGESDNLVTGRGHVGKVVLQGSEVLVLDAYHLFVRAHFLFQHAHLLLFGAQRPLFHLHFLPQ
jgi:hypothetical protein